MHIDVLPAQLTVIADRSPFTRMSIVPVDHPYLNDVWRPLVGDAATRVLHDLAAMVTDQRTGLIDLGDLYPSRGFVLDVDEFIHSLGLRPGRGHDGELLPILCQFMAWRVAGFLGQPDRHLPDAGGHPAGPGTDRARAQPGAVPGQLGSRPQPRRSRPQPRRSPPQPRHALRTGPRMTRI